MTESAFPPPPKVRESRFDDWMWRFYRRVDGGGLGSRWTASGNDIYRATGSVALGTTPPAGQSASFPILYMGSRWAISTSLSVDAANAYFDGSNWKRIGAGRASSLNHGSGEIAYYTSASSTAGSTVSFIEAFRVKTNRETLINPSYINVRQYGATGDGSTNDTTAISDAIAAAVANGMRRVYFPQGNYKVTSSLTISGDMMLFGDGPATSIIIFDPASSINCINYSGTTTIRDTEKLEIHGIAFRANSTNCNAAIYGRWTVSGTGAFAASQPCLFTDVDVGSNSSSAAFTYGINLEGAAHGAIENCTFYHYESGAVKASSAGIVLNGSGGTYNVTDFKIKGCTFARSYMGAYFIDTEGIHFNQNTVLSCDYGAVWDTTLTIGKPYFDCTGNHFAVGIYGVYINEMVQGFVGDNLIYGLRSQSLSSTFYGVYIASGSAASSTPLNSIVRDNTVVAIEDSGTFTTAYGVYVAGGSGTAETLIIKGTTTVNCDRMIYLDSSVVNTIVLDDNTSSTNDVWEDVSGANSLPYGTYTPTGYGVTNCVDADITEYEANWTRYGNLITVYGDVDVDPTAAAAVTTFRLSLPFAVNLSAATMCSGVINPSGVNAPGGTAQMHTGTSPDRVEFNFYATVATATRFSYTYRYRVS